jgi:hypothetical protein
MSNSATGGNSAAWGIATATSPGMLSTAEQDVAGAKHFIAGVLGPGTIPLGSVISTCSHIIGAYNCTATITADAQGFVLCNGQQIVDATSPMDGQFMPDINGNDGTPVFLRGSTSPSSTKNGSDSFTISSTNLPTHTHGVGTIAVANESAHTHAVGTYANAAESAHTHGVGTYGNTAEEAHTHASALPAHRHFMKVRGTSASGATDSYGHAYTRLSANLYYGPLPASGTGAGVQEAGNHTHTWGGSWSNDNSSTIASPEGDGSGNTYQDGVGYWGVNATRTTSAGSSHNHAFTGTSAVGSSHNHTISGASAAGTLHTHTISGSTDNGSFTNTSISNIPKYIAVKYIIRIK